MMGFLASLFFAIVAWLIGFAFGIATERGGWSKATGEPTSEAFAARRGVQSGKSTRAVMTGNDAA